MPSVTPSDGGGYNYYHKAIQELEDEYQLESKRNRDRHQDQVNQLEEHHNHEIRKREKELDETVQNIKDEHNETLTRERDFNKAEVDRIRNQTYDKWGRYNGLEGEVVQRQLENAKEAWDVQHRNDQRALQDSEEAYHHKLERLNRDHATELERVAQYAHDSASEMYNLAYDDQKEAYDAQRVEAERKYNELNQERMEDMNFQRRQAEQAINDSRDDFEHRVRKLKQTDENRADRQQRHYADSMDEATRALNDSHARETKQLRDQLKELTYATGEYSRGRSEGSSDAIAEYENEWRSREEVTNEAYEQQIKSLKQKSKEADTYYAQLNDQNLRDVDRYFSDLLSKQNMENYQSQRQLEATFEQDRDMLVDRMKQDRKAADQNLEKQLNEANEQRNRALENQAKAYQDTIGRNRSSSEDTIKNLERQLLYKSTSDDTSVISPAAEAAVRKAVVNEYEKTFMADRTRSEDTIDSIQREYAHRLHNTIIDNDADKAVIQSENAADRHRLQSEMLQHVQDTEFIKDNTLRNQELDHMRETQNLNRNYSTMLDRQRRQYEEILVTSKNDAAAKIQAVRQEAEFQSKMAQRAFSAQQNELIRGYEKKLNDQKTSYEEVLYDAKAQADRQVRENDRKNRLELEEQSRAYEQKIAQMEFQQKERERYLTRNFQDELEKVRRSNALLAKKKG